MNTTHQAQVPKMVVDYFHLGSMPVEDLHSYRGHPVVAQVFYLDRGWRRSPIRKRVSCAWLRKLKAQGVTHVALSVGGRLADFGCDEILRYERGGR